MPSFWNPLRVGIVIALAASAFGLFLYFISGNPFQSRTTYRVYAIFDDATGLGVRTRVQVAGIPVGQVDRIELDQNTAKAKVWMLIRQQYVLHRNAAITKRSESILGDFLLDVFPGTADQPTLHDGDEIRNVVRTPSMNDVFVSLSKIAGDIGEITTNLRKVLGGEEGETNIRNLIGSLQRITSGIERVIDTSGAKLDATLANFQRFSGDLSRLSSDEGEDIVAILKNTRQATSDARDILRTIGGVIGSSQKGELKESVTGIKQSLDKLDLSLQNVQEITDKINKGQGTIGHLVNDDKLAKNLDKAALQLTSILGTPDSLKIEVSERSEFLIGVINAKAPVGSTVQRAAYSPWTKNYFGLRIIPRPDKWYGFEIIDDPRGVTKRVHVINDPSNPPNFPSEYDTTTTERQLKFSVYLAKRYGVISGRFGILENTGGFGLQGHFFNDRLTVALDAFEFANPLKEHPRIKFYVNYHFLDHLLITVGADDLANKPEHDRVELSRIISGRDYFVGAGVYFTDDDIKMLIAALPFRL